MLSFIVLFPKLENGKSIKNVLVRCGLEVQAVCTLGAQAISLANELDEGIIICGYKFADMHYLELYNYLPRSFQMLLIASPAKLSECMNNEIICLGMPLKTKDLMNTLEMMTYQYTRQKKKKAGKQRSQADKDTIDKAKIVLMERNNMSEEEAHRYIQKTSMDSGTNMVETAEMILSMMR
ncbi:ANTAR domain-containing response regulator [[Clostridium] polysaccharolyticum]|uniref:Response regulator NasT n=1 Tax=[Clostridium] polysaccharolyticum TaxID=29364 RepID=A0A1H9YP01_9FIRM|nr:ANTAR domain-containing protein [[Clostridium] polysaccharolyticum]SES70773.1 response regulator NasT [[Clostridium] polysaccharolyticum]